MSTQEIIPQWLLDALRDESKRFLLEEWIVGARPMDQSDPEEGLAVAHVTPDIRMAIIAHWLSATYWAVKNWFFFGTPMSSC